jgi:hypothetical protein
MSTSSIIYTLKKSRPGCTGMFWRSSPDNSSRVASNDNWPRDGAQLKGTVIEYKGAKWLNAFEVKQANSSEWVKAPAGAYMPFQYDNHYYLDQTSVE